MITELRIEGFKSFGLGMRPIRLEPLSFLVGANASGKTNLISALRFLRACAMQNVEIAADEFGGLAEIRNKLLRERPESKPLSIRLTIAPLSEQEVGYQRRHIAIPRATYDLRLNVRKESGKPEVRSENLTADLVEAGGLPVVYRMTPDAILLHG